jgi:hypothetical protein
MRRLILLICLAVFGVGVIGCGVDDSPKTVSFDGTSFYIKGYKHDWLDLPDAPSVFVGKTVTIVSPGVLKNVSLNWHFVDPSVKILTQRRILQCCGRGHCYDVQEGNSDAEVRCLQNGRSLSVHWEFDVKGTKAGSFALVAQDAEGREVGRSVLHIASQVKPSFSGLSSGVSADYRYARVSSDVPNALMLRPVDAATGGPVVHLDEYASTVRVEDHTVAQLSQHSPIDSLKHKSDLGKSWGKWSPKVSLSKENMLFFRVELLKPVSTRLFFSCNHGKPFTMTLTVAKTE